MKRLLLSLSLILAATLNASTAADTLVYFGTYTRGNGGSEGIYVSRLNPDTGELSEPKLAAKVANPSFLEIHPNREFLYAVSEIANLNGEKTGGVSAFKIDRDTGKLTLLNEKPSGGGGPCHISIAEAKCVLVANYGGGSTACLAIQDDGSLKEGSFIQHEGSSVNERRQAGPHAHSANPGPNNRFAFVADLGLDKVLIYKLDPAPCSEIFAAAGSSL